MGLFGPPDIAKLKAKRDVNGLIKALTYQKDTDYRSPLYHESAGIRRAAAEALGQIGDGRATEPLAALLQDGSEPVRYAAAMALSTFRDARALEPLVVLLNQRLTGCASVATALGELGDARAVGPLVNALEIQTECTPRCPNPYEYNQAYESLRQAAAEALGRLGQPAVGPLIKSLGEDRGDGREMDRHAAVEALVRIGQPALEPLAAALQDSHTDHQAVAEALAKLGQPAVERLKVALREGDPSARLAAAGALTEMGVPADPATRAWHVVAMQKWDEAVAMNAAAVEPLAAALKLRDVSVRNAATKALVTIGQPAFDPLVATLRDSNMDARLAAAKALGALGDARAVEPLIAAIKGSNRDVHWAVVMAVYQLGDVRAVELLIPMLEYWRLYSWAPAFGKKVSRTAAEALGRLGDARAVPPLLEALKSDDWDLITLAYEALARIGQPAAEPLVATLKNTEQWARKYAIEALGEIGQPAVEPLLSAFTYDSTIDVTETAKSALVRIGSPAVLPLLRALGQAERGIYGRVAVAQALAALYRSGGIDDKSKALILAETPTFNSLHTDSRVGQHADCPGSNSHIDADCVPHTDFFDAHKDTPAQHTDIGMRIYL
jgi:HEAT repeat protein